MRRFIGNKVDQSSLFVDRYGTPIRVDDILRLRSTGDEYIVVAFNQDFRGDHNVEKVRLKSKFSESYSWTYIETLNREWEVAHE